MIYADPGESFEAWLAYPSLASGLVGTLTVRLIEADGTVVVAATTAGITEPVASSARYVVTLDAPDETGSYLVIWHVGVGNEVVEPLIVTHDLPAPVGLTPGTDDVARLLLARTVDESGNRLGNFTSDTRPTGDQVEGLITTAVEEVQARLGETILTTAENRAGQLAALYAAMLVELSYFPEQVDTDRSAYDRLKDLYDQGIDALMRSNVEGGSRPGMYSAPVISPTNLDGWEVP